MNTQLLSFQDASLGYGSHSVMRHVTFSLCEGDYFAVVGPNGAGKSTLVKSIIHNQCLLSGQRDMSRALDIIGYVPQKHSLSPCFPLTALDVVLMGTVGQVSLLSPYRKANRKTALQALAKVRMEEKEAFLFRELSGGQQQRVLIARALATGSPLLLLDEPCVGMDVPSEREVLSLIDRLNTEEQKAVVLVTHSRSIARRAKHVAVIENGELVVCMVDELDKRMGGEC